MGTSGRAGVLAAAAGLSRAAAWAPGLAQGLRRRARARGRGAAVLPLAAGRGDGGRRAQSLRRPRAGALGADRADPRLLGLAFLARARPVAFGVTLALAALFAGFLAMSLRTARVAAPVLDRIRIVSLTGIRRGGRPEAGRRAHGDRGRSAPTACRRTRFRRASASRRARRPIAVAGDFVALKARLLPPSHASLPGRLRLRPRRVLRRRRRGRLDARRDPGPAAAGGREPSPALRRGDRPRPQPPRRAGRPDHRRRRGRDRRRHGDGQARLPQSNDAKDLIREAGIFHIITISGVQMTLVAGIFFVVTRRLLALSPTLALNYPIKKWAARRRHGGLAPLRRRDRLARRHRAGAGDDADRARRGRSSTGAR